MDLRVVAPVTGIAAISEAFETLAGAIGGPSFNAALASSIRMILPVDRLYLFDILGPKVVHLKFATYETGLPPTQHEVYVSDYLPVDPILGAIKIADHSQQLVVLRVSPEDILQARYRKALRSADIVERISIVRRSARRWQCLNLARKSDAGTFTPDEVARLINFASFLLPLTTRHSELVGLTAPRRLTTLELEGRFAAMGVGLTMREIQVCARAALGMTVEGAALELGIGRASVLTYRKRAYARLSVTSANELCKLVMA